MVAPLEVAEFLNKELNVAGTADSSNNGLQVDADTEVEGVAFAVDAALEVFRQARKAGAGMVVVHHGISWKDSLKYITGINFKRLEFLIKNNMALYAAHLPLDMHPRLGNNARLASLLGLRKLKKFGYLEGAPIGFSGELNNPNSVTQIAERLGRALNARPKIYAFGNKKIKTVGIVSGNSNFAIEEAAAMGIDCFVSGEPRHGSYHDIKEHGLNVIYAGHYATETLGVRALMPSIRKKFRVKTVFIDSPTGL
ncbi:Nif3-like dinuclear metal center hexameric protein [Candidatus Woesearchaeota archaeon]|nr:Nif3-like dinuclear metal center hexameric protein [Candidatus Woesearchaeota archaeon]